MPAACRRDTPQVEAVGYLDEPADWEDESEQGDPAEVASL